jgi:hypothetical protein
LQVSDELRWTGADIRAYFEYFARVPGLALVPGSYKASITIDGDVATSSGYYAFVLPNADGSPSNVPARFTFVYRRHRRGAGGWDIIAHHSSKMPVQPAKLHAPSAYLPAHVY